MIKRINLIEKETLRITYGIIFTAFSLSLSLCLLIYGTVALSEIQTKTHIQLLKTDIQRLKVERDKLMTRGETNQTAGPIKEIGSILNRSPSWFGLLNSLTLSLPSSVWLVSFKGYDREESASKKGVLLNGTAKSPQGLSLFLSRLEETPFFEKVVLTTSKEEGGIFNFSVSCDISNLQGRH